MIITPDNIELIKTVNPVVNSAKGALLMLKDANVPEAIELFSRLHLDQGYPDGRSSLQQDIGRVFFTIQELRYTAITYYAESLGISNIIDLGCGYSPRGLYFKSTEKFNYLGVDLPLVIKETSVARNDLNYVAADITNLSSLKKALNHIVGKILIITEGVLSYLSESELDTAVKNIFFLLNNHKGIWITPDFYDCDYVSAVMEPNLGKEEAKKIQQMMHQSADKSSVGTELRGSDAAAKKGINYVTDYGFQFKEIPFIHPSMKFRSFDSYADKRTADAVLENYRNFKIGFIFIDNSYDFSDYLNSIAQNNKSENLSFSSRISEDSYTIFLKGRLDTISAPELLDYYEASIKSRKFEKKIVIDCQDLEYVSSAGLRVFLIIYKERKDQFKLININETVDDVLSKVGFKDLFCE